MPEEAHDVTKHRHWQRFLTELIGTFALTAVAVGTDLLAVLAKDEMSTLMRALAPASLVMAFVYALGNVSGAHFNPAVTFAFVLRRACTWRLIPLYWLAQLLGACLAALFMQSLLGSVTAAVTRPHLGTATAFWCEVFLAFLLVTVVLGTATRYSLIGANAALPVGAIIGLGGILGLPISGASFNPARSFGPAVVSGEMAELWLYLTAPLLGAAIAVLVTTLLHHHRHHEEQEAAEGS